MRQLDEKVLQKPTPAPTFHVEQSDNVKKNPRDEMIPYPRRGVNCDCKNMRLDDSGFCANCGGETI